MKIRAPRCAVMFALLFIGASDRANAVPPKNAEAEARAAGYQAEARTVFSRRGWRIARDKPGVLIMEHNMGYAPSYGGQITPDFVDTAVFGVAQIIVTFKPVSMVNTSCAVDARQYSQRKQAEGKQDGYRVLTEDDLHPSSKDKSLNGPYPMKSEEMLKMITDLLDKARERMIKSHPEFAAK